MYKIFLTVRNRLSSTVKCIEAIKRHSKLEHQLYVYDNITNYKIDEHFAYFSELYKEGIITQVTFNTAQSTFGAFSKAVASNMFGLQHQQDPNKYLCEFLVILDNDTCVCQDWDEILSSSWKEIKKRNLNNIKILTNYTMGIVNPHKLNFKINDIDVYAGKYSGSSLWCVQNDFFEDVGLLNLERLVGVDKKHDQQYWNKLKLSSNSDEYVAGLDTRLSVDFSVLSGSLCNILSSDVQNKEELIKLERGEDSISEMSFEYFYDYIKKT
jgi:hypothetical protein